MYSYNWLFSWQSNNLREKFLGGLLFNAKILQEAMQVTSPTWAKSLTKFNPEMQNFKRVFDLNCKQKKNWTT